MPSMSNTAASRGVRGHDGPAWRCRVDHRSIPPCLHVCRGHRSRTPKARAPERPQEEGGSRTRWLRPDTPAGGTCSPATNGPFSAGVDTIGLAHPAASLAARGRPGCLGPAEADARMPAPRPPGHDRRPRSPRQGSSFRSVNSTTGRRQGVASFGKSSIGRLSLGFASSHGFRIAAVRVGLFPDRACRPGPEPPRSPRPIRDIAAPRGTVAGRILPGAHHHTPICPFPLSAGIDSDPASQGVHHVAIGPQEPFRPRAAPAGTAQAAGPASCFLRWCKQRKPPPPPYGPRTGAAA